MDIRQLRYLVAVLDEGTFTAAADACHVSQPALSSGIATLEREYGAVLFHRIGRGVVPTAACEELEPRARDALRAFAAVERSREGVGAVAGRLDLAVQPTLVHDPAPALIAAMRREHPAVTFRLRTTGDDESVASLVETGECEVALGERVRERGLVWHPVREERFVVVHPPRTDVDESAGVRTLGGVPVVAPPPGSPTRAVLDRVVTRAGVRIDIVVEAEHREALVALVAAGVGSALVPEPTLAGRPRSGLVIVEPTPPIARTVGVQHRDAPLTPVAAAFVALARARRTG